MPDGAHSGNRPAHTFDLALLLRIISGAMIPALANIVFNLLDFFVETYGGKSPCIELSASVFDIAPGCTFAIVGLCITARNNSNLVKLVIVLNFLILLIVGGSAISVFFKQARLAFVLVIDVFAFIGLAWAIAEAG